MSGARENNGRRSCLVRSKREGVDGYGYRTVTVIRTMFLYSVTQVIRVFPR